MPRHPHAASDVDVQLVPSSARGQLSRRHLLGGLLSAAAVGVARTAGAAPAPAPRALADVRRTTTVLRLGSNENPCGLCPAARQAFLAAADEANRYPGRASFALVEAIAAQHKVDSSWIYLTPGSGELLRAATVAFTSASRSLVAADPTFEAPARVAGMIGSPVQAVPVTADGHLDLEAMAAKAAGAGLFFVCNPNNPTGSHVTGTAVADFVAKVKSAAPEARVLVDEAYFEYVDDPAYTTAVPLAVADKRVLVTRTFSKIFGMAGLRVGYAIAHPETLAALRKEGSSGIMSSASLAAAAAALADTGHLATERARNEAARRFTRARFEAAGYRVLPSSANFVMIDIRRDAGAFAGLCRQQQVFVARPFPPLTTCVRLSIGTMPEMEEAVPAMLALLEAPATARVEAVQAGWSPGGAC
jgi:histidinol-phosphate aminotransferase